MSPEACLDWEPLQDCRYEYIDGEVFAMMGGTKPHNRIAAKIRHDWPYCPLGAKKDLDKIEREWEKKR